MNIPEKAIEAAAIASYVGADGGTVEDWRLEDQSFRDAFLDDAHRQIEAAAPFIAAQALRDAAEILDQPAYDNAAPLHLYMIARSLRTRATTIESEAPNA